MTGPLHELAAAEVEVLELEVLAAASLAAAGFPVDLTRPPNPVELRSRTSFAGIEDDVRQAAGELAALARAGRAEALRLLAGYLDSAPDAAGVMALVDELAAGVSTLPGAAHLLEQVASAAGARLDELADVSLQRFLADGARAGIQVDPSVRVSPSHRAAISEQARRLAADSVDAATRAVRGAAYTTVRADRPVREFIGEVLGKAADTGVKALDDLASQTALRANGAGRSSALDAIASPVEIYASELLDRNTCAPCAGIDGEPLTREQADELYPSGGYVECLGGDRCRGTIVVVDAGETRATLTRPGDRAVDTTDRQPVVRR